ncbi:MAG TPA: BTAD domain-containing putative transcriptional regulator [Gemmatimonadota bacterium]|nr:BTAD domain-containing putative transcriptional regulator [Gemmatimonadota bacterium]
MRPILRLLGGAAIEADGAVVASPATQRHRLALLALLAASPRRTLSRDKLVGLLWPDHGQEDARHLLRQAVYMIRKELGESVLESAGEQITLDPGLLPNDLADFERALAEGDPRRAVDLYGGPFLDGFHLPGADEFERWADGERDRLAAMYGESLEALAEEAERAADWDAASRWWGRLAAHDPYDSGIALRLMQARAAMGDRGGALRHAEEHAELLERELGAPPDPRVAELAERLRGDVRADLDETVAVGVHGPPIGVPSAGVGPGRRLWPWAGFAGLGVLAAVVVWFTSRDSPTLSDDRVAILPFEVRGDERFAYLGDGMVDLLSSKVEGAGRLKSVDPRAVLSFAGRRESRGSSLDLGRAAAREFRAGLFVAGTVVAAGERLEIHATLYDADGTARTRLPPVAGGEGEIFAMVDQLARGLVASRYQAEGERLSRLAATTTSSMPALRSWLSGEAAFRAGRFDQAVEEFRRAAEQDTTFALAWYRLAVAEEWSLDLEAAEEAVSRAVRHGGRLAERDRLLLEAWQAYFSGRATDAERLYRRILEAHPEDVEAWFQLAEVQFHYGPPGGRPIAEPGPAFQRVVELEPNHEGALLHLARIAARAGRVAEIDSLAEHLRRFSPASELEVEMRTLAAFARPDAAAREAVAAELAELDDAAVFTAIWTASYADPVGGTERLARILTEAGRPPDVRATGHLLLATASLGRGRLEAARRELAAAARDDPDRALPFRALFAAPPFLPPPVADVPAVLAELRAWNADSIPPGLGTGVFLTVHDGIQPVLQAYLTSLLAKAAGEDGPSLAAMRGLERFVGPERARGLARDLSLGARAEILGRANAAEALAALEQIQGQVPYERAVASPFFALSRERWLEAGLLNDLGRPREALPLYGSFLDTSLFDLPYLAPSHLARARIHERLGERGDAVRHYRQFIELWREADPELRPRVEEARRRLARLVPASAP